MQKLIPLAISLRLLIPFLIYLPSRYSPPFDSSHLILQREAAVSEGLRWDAIHYTSIALHGYQYEQQGAWMPLWPIIMRYMGLLIHYTRRESNGLDVQDVVIGGEVVNILMNLGSTFMLYK